jgi:xylulokinase
VRITGGGAHVALWRKILAGILNRRMIHAGGDATLGAAIVVAAASGYYRDIPLAVQAMVHTKHIEDPNPEQVAQYQVAFKAYIDLASRLGFRQIPEERGGML